MNKLYWIFARNEDENEKKKQMKISSMKRNENLFPFFISFRVAAGKYQRLFMFHFIQFNYSCMQKVERIKRKTFLRSSIFLASYRSHFIFASSHVHMFRWIFFSFSFPSCRPFCSVSGSSKNFWSKPSEFSCKQNSLFLQTSFAVFFIFCSDYFFGLFFFFSLFTFVYISLWNFCSANRARSKENDERNEKKSVSFSLAALNYVEPSSFVLVELLISFSRAINFAFTCFATFQRAHFLEHVDQTCVFASTLFIFLCSVARRLHVCVCVWLLVCRD